MRRFLFQYPGKVEPIGVQAPAAESVTVDKWFVRAVEPFRPSLFVTAVFASSLFFVNVQDGVTLDKWQSPSEQPIFTTPRCPDFTALMIDPTAYTTVTIPQERLFATLSPVRSYHGIRFSAQNLISISRKSSTSTRVSASINERLKLASNSKAVTSIKVTVREE